MKLSISILAILLLPPLVSAQKITVSGGKSNEAAIVVAARVPAGATAANTVALPDGSHLPAQIVGEKDAQRIVFVLPKFKAGETVEVTPTMLNYVVAPPHFEFIEKKGEPTELDFVSVKTKRPVLQYFNLPHSAAEHYYTFKPFHNVYDPATGKVMLTNSAVKNPKEGLYPHHRGLFFGFNKITYDGKQADIWHGTNNVYSEHEKTLSTEAGEVLGRQRSRIAWHGRDGKTFATEEREVTAYSVPNTPGTLIDWNTVLSTKLEKVRLDGDPQHAGFHFRANQEVAKNGKENTYYLRPDGKGKVGDTRNWEAKKPDPRTVNLPWNAMSFVVDGKRYTALRIDHPDNPKESRGSERDYGRFGDYFEYDLTPAKPLRLRYRVWVQEGEMTVEECKEIAETFVHPPAVK
ncbi:MAG TPA: DUF6807 family protein [Gemmata sp.]|nr:DUF6807 family protein [Gemmata sp.]